MYIYIYHYIYDDLSKGTLGKHENLLMPPQAILNI